MDGRERQGATRAPARPSPGAPPDPFGEEGLGRRTLRTLRAVWNRVVTPAVPRRPAPPAPGREPRRATWTRVLGVSLAAFFLWLLLDAPTLQHNAQVSPVGTRRSVSLSLLRPIAALSRDLGLSHVVSVADGVLGRNQSPGLVQPPSPVRHHGGTATPSTTTTTVPKVTFNPRPSAADPLRVLVVGDSLGIDLGNVLVNDLSQTGVVQATLDGQVATGLTRPDYFNWSAELASDLPKYTPQVIVIMLGANDAQDLPGPPDVPFGTSSWLSVYRTRVASFMALAASRGARVIWVGMPPMQNPGLSQAMQTLNGIVSGEARTVPHVVYVDSSDVLGTPSGQFTPYVVEGGQEVNVREPDGTHIAPGGAQLLSSTVEAAMKNDLGVHL